ncbi:10046_t:CDS:2 [Paraglomus brasilianum]|uniref:10046_t:CDS:1 n=1 Tax=Paraglomus brasilianum TaxID=144538 RepID=A0A9N9G933_9GLOM|nr:10046_t:CDS:2 [Paraglomus brasilianum]
MASRSKSEQFAQSSKSLKEMMIVRSRINRHSIRLTLFIVVITLLQCAAVKREDFRTCAQTSFCRRNRAYADQISDNNLISPYIATRESLKLDGGILSGEIVNTLTLIKFTFTLDLLEGNMARLRVNEKNPIAKRYSQTSKYVLVGEPKTTKHYRIFDTEDDPLVMNIAFGDDEQNELLVYCSPFRIEFYRQDKAVVVLNERGLLNYEHLREKAAKPQPPLVDQSGEGDNTEDVKSGSPILVQSPESIAMDITFSGVEHVYGIPEHATSFSLKETRGGDDAYTEPYRLYNLDVFEYELDNAMALYGSIPFMIAHHSDSTAAVLWLNGAETWIDVVKSKSKDSKVSIL